MASIASAVSFGAPAGSANHGAIVPTIPCVSRNPPNCAIAAACADAAGVGRSAAHTTCVWTRLGTSRDLPRTDLGLDFRTSCASRRRARYEARRPREVTTRATPHPPGACPARTRARSPLETPGTPRTRPPIEPARRARASDPRRRFRRRSRMRLQKRHAANRDARGGVSRVSPKLDGVRDADARGVFGDDEVVRGVAPLVGERGERLRERLVGRTRGGVVGNARGAESEPGEIDRDRA